MCTALIRKAFTPFTKCQVLLVDIEDTFVGLPRSVIAKSMILVSTTNGASHIGVQSHGPLPTSKPPPSTVQLSHAASGKMTMIHFRTVESHLIVLYGKNASTASMRSHSDTKLKGTDAFPTFKDLSFPCSMLRVGLFPATGKAAPYLPVCFSWSTFQARHLQRLKIRILFLVKHIMSS